MAEHDARQTAPNEVELDLRRLWEVLLKRRFYVIGTFVVVLLVTALVTFMAVPMYRASADLMVRRTDPSLQAIGLPSDLAQMVTGARTGDVGAHLELVRSHRVMEMLTDSLTEDPAYVEAAAAAGRTHNPVVTAGYLRSATSVRQISGTDMIRVEATAESPREAALIANHLAEVYQVFDRDRARRSLQTVNAFLDQQIAETKSDLELSEAELSAFARDVGMALQQQALVAKISRLEQLHAEASVELEDTRSQLEQVNRFLENVRAELIEDFAAPDGVPLILEVMDKLTLIRSIQREIAGWEREREEALLEEDYLRAQNLQTKIIDRRREMERTATDQFTMLDMLPQYEKLIQEQLALTLKAEALENRVRVLDRQIEREVDRILDYGVPLARLQRELDVSEELYTLLLSQYARVSIAEIAELGRVELINPARAPSSPFRPSKRLNLLVGAFLGVLGGVGVAFVREALDTTFRSTEELEKALGVPVLGSVPKIRTRRTRHGSERVRELLFTQFQSGSPEYEVFMGITTNLRFMAKRGVLRSVVVTGAGLGAGKSMIAANLALSWSSNGKRVVLVDADLRRPVLERALGVEKDGVIVPGLVELAHGGVSLDEVTRIINTTDRSNPLHFIPAGRKPANVVDFFSSEAFGQTLERLHDHYDVIIFDTPPVNVAADPLIIASHASGTILVVDAERTTKSELNAAQKALTRAEVKVLGTVFNKVPRRRQGYYGAYGYGYGTYDRREGQSHRP